MHLPVYKFIKRHNGIVLYMHAAAGSNYESWARKWPHIALLLHNVPYILNQNMSAEPSRCVTIDLRYLLASFLLESSCTVDSAQTSLWRYRLRVSVRTATTCHNAVQGHSRSPILIKSSLPNKDQAGLQPVSHRLRNFANYWSNFRRRQRKRFCNAYVWGEFLNSELRNLASRNYRHQSITFWYCKRPKRQSAWLTKLTVVRPKFS